MIWSITIRNMSISCSPKLSRVAPPTQPPVQWMLWFLIGVKAAGACCWPSPTTADVRNEWICTSVTPTSLRGVGRNSFTFMAVRCHAVGCHSVGRCSAVSRRIGIFLITTPSEESVLRLTMYAIVIWQQSQVLEYVESFLHARSTFSWRLNAQG